jgi:hypothetical protein
VILKIVLKAAKDRYIWADFSCIQMREFTEEIDHMPKRNAGTEDLICSFRKNY